MTQANRPDVPWQFALAEEGLATFHKVVDGVSTPQQVTIWSHVVSISPAVDWWYIEKSTAEPDHTGFVVDTFVAVPVAVWAVVESVDSDGDRWQEVAGMVAYAGDHHLSLVSATEQFVRGANPEMAFLNESDDRLCWHQRRKANPSEWAKHATT